MWALCANCLAEGERTLARPLVFVITGESNSGGVGKNAKATAEEMKPRSCVQIMNLTDGKWGIPRDFGRSL